MLAADLAICPGRHICESRTVAVDDAGGGLRGLRAGPSRGLLDAVRQAYGLDFNTDPVDLGGSSNLNLLIVDRQDRWVVRVYRKYVTPARLRQVHLVRSALE